jgi:hypothetical protein
LFNWLAVFKKGISTEFSQVTKPKMKNNTPIITIDLLVLFWLVAVLAAIGIYLI